MSQHLQLRGAMTALVTPFRDRGGELVVDDAALSAHCEGQIEAGIAALVPCGTTGEAAALSLPEYQRVVRVAAEAARGRVPIVAGVGSPSTAHSLELGRLAREAGADALLAVTPYYNKPTQEGLVQHYEALCQLGLPLVLYNVPGRTGCDLLPETVARLCELSPVIAIKEATGWVQRGQQILQLVGDRLALLSGEDAINYPLYAIGASGTISVVSNVAPRLTADIWEAASQGDHGRARSLHYRFLPLAEAMFWEPNPIPAKAALGLLGRMEPHVRLPLCPLSADRRERLRLLLSGEGLL